MIRRSVEVTITATPEELAHEFCAMNGDQQALFFNEIASNAITWNRNFAFQLQAITDSYFLASEGRTIMRQIGEYSAKIE